MLIVAIIFQAVLILTHLQDACKFIATAHCELCVSHKVLLNNWFN